MTILDLLLFVVGLAGVGFMIYAFSLMKLFSSKVRWLGISLLILITVLFGDRITSPKDTWNFPGWGPARSPDTVENLFRTGWQEIPYVMFNLLLAEFGNFDDAVEPPTSPSPSAIPSPPPSPVPRTSSPTPSLTPAVPSPTLAPSVPPAVLSPSPTPPSPMPTVPDLPPRTAPDREPAPAPTPSIAPQQPPTPVPAWW